MVVAIYVITLLVSSSLLFLVQPMFARMVLPHLGGTPAVWNTCMVFFQAALLGGYLYAHLSTKWLGVRRQAIVHLGILVPPLLFLPMAIGAEWKPPASSDPTLWLLMLSSATIGLPFVVVSASAPLLQRWFSATNHPQAGDPYFLYSASNAGSMTALLAYPFLLEPTLALGEQSMLWMYGYIVLMALIVGCAVALLTRSSTAPPVGIQLQQGAQPHSHTVGSGEPLSWTRRVRWLALAAVPSSLMLGVTTYITTDIAVVPLLWVIPLALYLLTFIVVFARGRRTTSRTLKRLLAPLVIMLVLMLMLEANKPIWLVLTAHLMLFFFISLICHGELADDRPSPRHLTEFYLIMSVGGVLGGMFNALVAPSIFTSIAEYPIAGIAACLLVLPPRAKDSAAEPRFWPGPGQWAALAGFAGIVVALNQVADWLDLAEGALRTSMVATIPMLTCYAFSRVPVALTAAITIACLAGADAVTDRGQTLVAHRSFFGVHRVVRAEWPRPDGQEPRRLNILFHGTTMHGQQQIDAENRPDHPREPIGYYHPDGPVGLFFRAYADVRDLAHVGLIGLGSGGLASYAETGQRYTYFEIDPVVQQIAEDHRFFTFLSDARDRDVDVDIVLGDARLTIAAQPEQLLDLIILDAFTSDAIPVHLLTREAIALYKAKLKPDGLLLFHISNRYLNLQPVVARLAGDAGLVAAINDSRATEQQMMATGRAPSTWVVLARQASDLDPLRVNQPDSPWMLMQADPDSRVWSDDYVDIISVMDWW